MRLPIREGPQFGITSKAAGCRSRRSAMKRLSRRQKHMNGAKIDREMQRRREERAKQEVEG